MVTLISQTFHWLLTEQQYVATLMVTMSNILTKCKLYQFPTYTPHALDLAPNDNFIFCK
jgi:hypothetical protein